MQIVVDHSWMYACFSSKTERRKKEWTLPRCIIVKFKQWNGEELHVFGNGKYLCGGRDHVVCLVIQKKRAGTGTYCALAFARERASCIL